MSHINENINCKEAFQCLRDGGFYNSVIKIPRKFATNACTVPLSRQCSIEKCPTPITLTSSLVSIEIFQHYI